jgi:hypothetical protein
MALSSLDFIRKVPHEEVSLAGGFPYPFTPNAMGSVLSFVFGYKCSAKLRLIPWLRGERLTGEEINTRLAMLAKVLVRHDIAGVRRNVG